MTKSANDDREKRIADAVAIHEAIEELRLGEGDGVEIFCENREGFGPDNNAIEVCADWTNWQPHRFEGSTLRLALENAVHEKRLVFGKVK